MCCRAAIWWPMPHGNTTAYNNNAIVLIIIIYTYVIGCILPRISRIVYFDKLFRYCRKRGCIPWRLSSCIPRCTCLAHPSRRRRCCSAPWWKSSLGRDGCWPYRGGWGAFGGWARRYSFAYRCCSLRRYCPVDIRNFDCRTGCTAVRWTCTRSCCCPSRGRDRKNNPPRRRRWSDTCWFVSCPLSANVRPRTAAVVHSNRARLVDRRKRKGPTTGTLWQKRCNNIDLIAAG